MRDAEACWVWARLSEYRWLFGSVGRISEWLDQPGSYYDGHCVRRKSNGEWIVGGCFSVTRTRREAILQEGLLILEKDLWTLEREILNSKNVKFVSGSGISKTG